MIHPFYPLSGRTFHLVDFRQTWGEERVYFHDEAGQLMRLPARWTDAKPVDAFLQVAAGRCHFRVDDLLRVVDLIARWQEAHRKPSGATGESECK